MPDPYEKDSNAEMTGRRVKLSQEYTQPFFDNFLDNYKHYFLRIIDEAVEADPDAYPFYSQLMIPITYQIVETILPRMFSRLPNFSIKTEEENDEKDEMALQSLIKYQMQHPYLTDDPVYVRLMTALKECFITGNAWGTVPWYLKDIKTTEWQPFSSALGIDTPSWDNVEKIKYYNVEPEWGQVKVTKRIIDAPVFEHESIFHVYPDVKKKRVSQLKYIIFEKDMTMGDIMELTKISPRDYKDLDKLRELKPITGEIASSTTNNYDQELAGMFGGKDMTGRDDTKDQGQYKVWIMQEPDKYSIVVNECLTIRESDNPNGDGTLGVFLMRDIPSPHSLYAWGEPDPIKKIEDGMTDQANMRNDAVFYDLLRMYEVNQTALVDGEEFIPEPGTVVHVKEPGAIKPIDTGSTQSSAYKEYAEWEKIIQNVSGVSDYATGQNGKDMTDTLGGIELLQQAANARFAMKLTLFEQLGLKAMGTMYVNRNLQFFDTPQSVPTEKGKMLIKPEQVRRLRGNIHFIVDTGSTESVNQTTEQTKWKTIIDMLGKPPFDHISPEGMHEIATQMLYALRVPNAEEILGEATKPGGAMAGFTEEQLQAIMQIVTTIQEKSKAAEKSEGAKVSVSVRVDGDTPQGQAIIAKELGKMPVTEEKPGGGTPAPAGGEPTPPTTETPPTPPGAEVAATAASMPAAVPATMPENPLTDTLPPPETVPPVAAV